MVDHAGVLDGRLALVTGAGRGIGAACARKIAAAGGIVVCADLDLGAVESLAERLNGLPASSGKCLALKLDVSNRTEVAEIVGQVLSEFGHIDVLANVAGVLSTGTVEQTTESDLDRAWSVNFKGTFFTCQAISRHMMQAGRGSIINMVSAAIDVPSAGFAAYAASKSAVATFTKTLAIETGKYGVRVNAIAPAQVNHTDMQDRHYRTPTGEIDGALRHAVISKTLEALPLPIMADPDDIAEVMLFLASDASRVMTGQILRPNSGIAMI